MSGGEERLIEVRNLRFRYEDGTQALNGVDFRLAPGETVALLGANGSGKTTFALCLVGLLTGEGEIHVCGRELKKNTLREIRRKVGFVFQDSDEQLFMPSVLEDVAFGLLSRGATPEAARRESLAALERVGMTRAASKAPYHLSAGEKRRVALAGVLVTQPEVLILDEPTTFLDPPGERDLVELLSGLSQAKLIITHDIPFARSLATRALFFEGGRIVSQGPVEEVVINRQWTPESRPLHR